MASSFMLPCSVPESLSLAKGCFSNPVTDFMQFLTNELVTGRIEDDQVGKFSPPNQGTVAEYAHIEMLAALTKRL